MMKVTMNGRAEPDTEWEMLKSDNLASNCALARQGVVRKLDTAKGENSTRHEAIAQRNIKMKVTNDWSL